VLGSCSESHTVHGLIAGLVDGADVAKLAGLGLLHCVAVDELGCVHNTLLHIQCSLWQVQMPRSRDLRCLIAAKEFLCS
jgi:hypothetical protein